jgi:hypothetical protein
VACLKRRLIECARLYCAKQYRPHRNQILQQFQRASLLGSWPVVEFVPIDLACKV